MKKVLLAFLLITGIYTLFCSHAPAAVTCVEAPGEAAIIGADVYSAREEAIIRAKWNAIESVSGVDIHAERVLQNMRIVDEAVIKRFDGIIEKHEILRETAGGDSVKVFLKVCVETNNARRAIESFSRNQSVTVIVPVKSLRSCTGTIDDNANDFTETLIEGLTGKGYSVHDVLPAQGFNMRRFDDIFKAGRFLSFGETMHRYLSNILIVGKIDQSEGKAEGDDIGFGLEMPANLVRSRLVYRIVRKDENSMAVLTAGVETGKGFGHDLCEAGRESLKDLAENAAGSISRRLQQHISGLAKKITVRITNVTDLNINFRLKAMLQNTAWVSAVEERSLGDFIVTYRENAVYLANSLVQKGNVKLVNFSPEEIILNYEQ